MNAQATFQNEASRTSPKTKQKNVFYSFSKAVCAINNHPVPEPLERPTLPSLPTIFIDDDEEEEDAAVGSGEHDGADLTGVY